MTIKAKTQNLQGKNWGSGKYVKLLGVSPY